MSTQTLTETNTERMLEAAVNALMSFGKQGDERAALTVSKLFATGYQPEALLKKVTLTSQKTGKAIVLPAIRKIVRAGYALSLFDITPEVAVAYATIGDKEFYSIADKQGASPDVRQAEMEALWESRQDTREANAEKRKEEKASPAYALPQVLVTLQGMRGDLSEDDKATIATIKAFIETLA